jgi:hypothetical protein
MPVRGILLLALALLAGCYKGPPADDPTLAGYGTRFPLGVLRPTTERPDVGIVAGIYPTHDVDDPFCCWTGPSATFEVAVPANRNALVVTIFIPALKPFKERRQSVDIGVDEGKALHFLLRDGVNFLHVPVPTRPHEHIAEVVLTSGWTFSPKAVRINGDGRELAFYLKAVRAAYR